MVERVGEERILGARVDESVDAAIGGEQRLLVVGAQLGLELVDQLLGLLSVFLM